MMIGLTPRERWTFKTECSPVGKSDAASMTEFEATPTGSAKALRPVCAALPCLWGLLSGSIMEP